MWFWYLRLRVWVLWLTLLPFGWKSRSSSFTQMLDFGSPLHDKKLANLKNFFLRKAKFQNCRLHAVQPRACQGYAAPRFGQDCWILRLLFPPRVEDSYFAWKQTNNKKEQENFDTSVLSNFLFPNSLQVTILSHRKELRGFTNFSQNGIKFKKPLRFKIICYTGINSSCSSCNQFHGRLLIQWLD